MLPAQYTPPEVSTGQSAFEKTGDPREDKPWLYYSPWKKFKLWCHRQAYAKFYPGISERIKKARPELTDDEVKYLTPTMVDLYRAFHPNE